MSKHNLVTLIVKSIDNDPDIRIKLTEASFTHYLAVMLSTIIWLLGLRVIIEGLFAFVQSIYAHFGGFQSNQQRLQKYGEWAGKIDNKR